MLVVAGVATILAVLGGLAMFGGSDDGSGTQPVERVAVTPAAEEARAAEEVTAADEAGKGGLQVRVPVGGASPPRASLRRSSRIK